MTQDLRLTSIVAHAWHCDHFGHLNVRHYAAAFDDALFMDSVMALAGKLAAMPAKALAETRRAIDLAIGMDYADAISMEADLQRQLGLGHDFVEGVAAFLAKRAPVFTDR
jgi:2-(1,2-epoxy-1,2-dihydrophenyl)acetyl-CoA isomerase